MGGVLYTVIDYMLRVVYEEDGNITVVTVYPVRRERYEGTF